MVHDFAYADLVFDDYRAPSLLQVPGAKEVGVEFFSMSKSFNMPGWRVGFAVGNPALVGALRKMKSYLDYGIFQPLQIASIVALNELEHEVQVICDMYQQRRDVLVRGLQRLGWPVQMPKGTMFVWAPIPEQYRAMGSSGVLQACTQRSQSGRVTRDRVWRRRGSARPLCPDRERPPHASGPARTPSALLRRITRRGTGNACRPFR